MKVFQSILVVMMFVFVSQTHSVFANQTTNNLVGQPSKPYTIIDIMYVKLIDTALKSLNSKGFDLDRYDKILVTAFGKHFFSVTFNLKDFHGFGASPEFPSWEVLIDGRTFKIVHERFPP